MNSTLLLLSLIAGSHAPPQDPKLAIVHVGVVDVAQGELLPDQTVLITEDRIVWVGPADEARVPDATKVLEGTGKFLIPGLWDMHVHLQWVWDAQISLPMFIAFGVTGVRDMASDVQTPSKDQPGLPALLAWREQIARGELVGPRLLALSSWPVATDRQTRGDAEALIDEFIERGADFVKVLQGLSAEVYFDIVYSAEERGLSVAGHVPLSVGMIEASNAGQVSIEHARDFLFDGFRGSAEWRRTTNTQNPPTAILRRMVDEHDPALVRRVAKVMAKNGTRYVPTHVTRRFDAFADDQAFLDDPRQVYVPALRWDSWAFDAGNVIARDPTPEGRAVLMDFYTKGLEATRTALDAGVAVLAGTDSNDSYVFPGSSLHDELQELVKAGLSPAQVLRTATQAGAEFLGRTEDHGAIEAGKKADLVLLRDNPLGDISHTRSIDAVIFDGRLHTRRDLDDLMRSVAAEVAKMDPVIEVAEAQLERFVGTFEAPMGRVDVSRVDNVLYFRIRGRPRMRLRALSETRFVFLPREITITFDVGSDGEVTSLRFEQGGQESMARKVE